MGSMSGARFRVALRRATMLAANDRVSVIPLARNVNSRESEERAKKPIDAMMLKREDLPASRLVSVFRGMIYGTLYGKSA